MKKIYIVIILINLWTGLALGQTQPNCQPTIINACTSFFPMGPPSFYINNFTLNGISSSSACSTPPNTNTTIFASSNLIGGTSYPFSISTLTSFPPFGFSHSIWLDSNDDGDFNDPNEQLLQSTGNFSPLLNGNITIPASSVSGLVHLRVISSSMPMPISDPCGNYSDSEVEDYVVQIQEISPCQPTISSNSPLPMGSNVELTCTSADSYSWTGPNGFTSTLQNPSITNATLANSGEYAVIVTSGTCNASATTNVTVVPPASLVAHYPFCSDANDATVNANNGSITGATLANDRFGNSNSAYSFDGDDKIEIADNAIFDLGTSNYSISYWMKSTQSSIGGMIMKMSPGNNYSGFTQYSVNGNIQARSQNADPVNSSSAINDNNWHHIVYTRNGNTQKLYIDNVLEGTVTGTPADVSNAETLTLGVDNTGSNQYYQGLLDDIKIYNGALNETEIANEFNSTIGCESGTCIPVISSNSPLCEGGSLDLHSSVAATYLWEGPNGFVSTDQNPSLANITVLESGIYTLTVTNGSGCTGTTTTEITVYDNSVCTGLIGHYKLDGNANDASGNNLHGIINGTLNASTDRFGNSSGAMHFDGNLSNFIEVADNPILRPSNVTVASWFRTADVNSFQNIISKVYGNCVGSSWLLDINQGSILSATSTDECNGYTLLSHSPISSNQWIHVAQVIDTDLDLIKLYINGLLVNSLAFTGSIFYDGNPILFGKDIDNGSPFITLNGDLDDVRIYGSAFTDQQVLDLYNFVPCEASILANTTILCQGNTLELSAPPTFSYSWTGPNGFVSTIQNPTIPNISPLATGVYSLSMTYGVSCTSTASITITVNPTATCEGLIAYYKLDGDAQDFSGNELHGTIQGTLNSATDIHGNSSGALHFDGNSGNYIRIEDNPLLHPANITISTWVKTSLSGSQALVGKPFGSIITNSWQILTNESNINSVIAFNNFGSYDQISYGLNAQNRWINVVQVIDRDNDLHKLYLNGELVGTHPFTAEVLYDNNALFLGVDIDWGSYGLSLNGDLDEVKIYGSAMSDIEVKELYESNCGIAISSNNPKCSGGNLNFLSNPANSYAWEGPNGFTSSIQNPIIENVSTAATGTYTLTAVLGTCTATATLAITINQTPIAPIVTGETEVCYGGTTVLTAECPVNTTAKWTNLNGNNLGFGPTLTTFEIYGNGSTISNLYISYCDDDITGCRSLGTNIEVTLVAPPPIININSSYICKGQTINLSSSEADTYAWTGPNSFTSNIQNPIIENTSLEAQGIYTLTVTKSGCTMTATTQVFVREVLLSSSSPTSEGGSLYLFSRLNQYDFSIYGYSWTGPNGFSSSLQNPMIENISLQQSGIYTLVATTSICVSTSTVNVIVSPLGSVSNNSPLCSESPLNIITSLDNNVSGQAGFFDINNLQFIESGPFGNNYFPFMNSMPTDNFTIEMWIKTSQTNGGLFYHGESNLSTYADKHIFIEDGYLKTRIIPVAEPGLSSGVLVNDNNWHHIAVTQKSENNEGTKIYIDGVLAIQSPNSNTCISAPKIYLGVERNLSWFDGNYIRYYDGLMDNVKVWNVAKSPTEIQDGMYSENSTSSNLVYIQKFNNSISEFNGSAPNGISYSAANIPHPFTFEWTGPNSFSSTVQNPSISNSQTNQNGIYTLTINAGGLESTLTTSVTVNPLPTVVASSNSPICAGTTLNLTASGGNTYAWTGPNGFTSADQNPSILNALVTNSGTYSVTVTDANSCVSSTQIVVVVNPLPTIVVGSNSPICAGATLNLTASGGTSYAWTGPNGFTSADQNPSILNALVTNSGTYSVTVTDANSCVSSAQIVVVVNPLPTVVVGSNSPICTGATLNLTASGGTTYAWTGPNGFTSADQNPSILNALVTNSGTYSVTVTDANSCVSSAQVVVVVNPLPTVVVGSNSPICTGATLNLTASGGTTYAWTGPNGFTSADQNPSISGALVTNSGTYSVTVTDANSCVSSAQVVVVVNPLPTVVVGSNSPICTGATLNLTASGGTTYAWTGPNGFTSADQNPSISGALVTNSGTYSVTVTDANSCVSSAQVVVVVNPLPTVVASSNSPICAGATLNLTASGGTTYAWTGPNGFTSTDQNPSILNALVTNSGTYSVTVTDANSCVSSTQIVVVVNPLPTIVVGSNSPICAGATLNLTASGGTSYAWTGPNGFTSADQNPSILNALVTNSGTYSVTVTDANSCVSSAQIVVVVNPLPTVVVGSNSPICTGATLNLTASGGTTYAWTGPNGFTSADQNPSILNALVTNSGTYSVTVTDANSCVSSAQVVVVVNPLPTVVVGSNSPICTGATLNLTASGGTTYAWTGPNGFTSADQNPSISGALVTNSGTYSVTVTDANSCVSSAQVVVVVNPLPTVVASSNSPICAGATLNLTASGGNTYAWTGPNGFTSADQNPSILNALVTNSGTYSVTVTDANSCVSSAQVVVVVNPLPTVVASSNSPICAGTTLNLTASGGTTYAWTGPNGFTSTDQNPSILNALVTNSGTYSVTVTDANSCISSAQVVVVVNPLPTVVASSNSPICASATLNLTASGGTTYAWTGPNGFTSTDQNPSILNALVTNSGTYSVTVTDANSCVSSAQVVVVVNPLPTVVASSNSPICAGTNLNLTASGGTTYAWTGPNGFTSADQNPSISGALVTNSGTYSVTVTDANSCVSSAQVVVVVNPLPTVVVGSNSPICAGATLNLTASGGNTYAWTGPNGFTSADQNPSILNALVTNSGTYSVTVTDANSCVSSAQVVVVVNPLPTVVASSNSPICAGTTLNLTASGGTTYAWTGPNGFTSTDQNPSILNALVTNSGTYSVTVTDANSCISSAQVVVVVNPLPTVVASSNSPICAGATLNLTASGGTTYAWTGPNGFTSTDQNPSILNALVTNSGTYSVTVTDANSCVSSAQLVVVVNPLPTVVVGSNSPICTGATLNLTASGGTTYAWTGPNGFTSADQNPSISGALVTNSGTYSVTVTDANSCVSSAQVVVVVNPLPTVVASSNSPICAGTTLNLTASGGTTYAWTGPNGFTSTDQNPSILNALVTNSGTYSVTVTDANSCISSAQVVVVVNPLPTVVASSNSPICASATLNLTASGGTTYAWTGPNGFTSADQNPSILNALVTNSGTYSVTVTDANSCVSSAQIVVVVNPLPTLVASSNNPICMGAALNLTASGGTSYAWTGPNGFTSADQNPSILNALVTNSGTYSVTVTDANSCISSAQVVVVVNPLPTVVASSNSPICAGTTLNLTASGGTTYAWTGPNGFASLDQNPSILNALVTNSGTYSVTVTDANSCVSSAQVSTIINGCNVPSQPSPIIGGPTACQGRLGLVYLVTAVPGATSYTWTYSGSGVSFVGGINNTRTITLDFSYSATSGILSVVANNQNGSSLPTTLSIAAAPAPASPSSSDITINNGESAQLTAVGCTFSTKWYSNLEFNQTNLLFTGNSYTSPSLNLDQTYFVACNNGTSCESSRIPVKVIVTCSPLLTITNPNYTSNLNIKRQASSLNGKIIASNKLSGQARISYEAKSVLLQPGFTANPSSGGVFKAEIGGCN